MYDVVALQECDWGAEALRGAAVIGGSMKNSRVRLLTLAWRRARLIDVQEGERWIEHLVLPREGREPLDLGAVLHVVLDRHLE